MIGHHGPVDPSELWTSWNLDPLLWIALVIAGGACWWALAARPHRERWRRWCLAAGLAVVALALVSPLDALSASLSSAHMVQHVLLTMVAAPLLVLGAPLRALIPALPATARRTMRSWRRSRAARWTAGTVADPVLSAGIFVAVLWVWHARGPYEAALDDELLHGVEHVMLFGAALASWAAIVNARRRRSRPGGEVLVLFGLSLQCALLGVLLTFSAAPWYPAYATTTEPWGLSPLADQQLAGVIMWVPAGGVYLVAALVVLSRWIGFGAGAVDADAQEGTPSGVNVEGIGVTR